MCCFCPLVGIGFTRKRADSMKIYAPLLCFFLSGCATHKDPCLCFSNTNGGVAQKEQGQSEQGQYDREKDPRDPFESFNRMVFSMNTTLDRTVLLPFIGFYRVMPPCLKNRIISLLDTVETPISMTNCLLQGKIHDFLAHTARLVFNTVFGILGLFDVASALNITPARQDFGKTLQKMAFIKPGPYIVMPFLGPSNLRDCLGQAVDCTLLPTTYWKDTFIPYYSGSYLITQAKITSIQQDISETFSDTYSALRDAYFMLREDSTSASPTDVEDATSEAESGAPQDVLGEDEAQDKKGKDTGDQDKKGKDTGDQDKKGKDTGDQDPQDATTESNPVTASSKAESNPEKPLNPTPTQQDTPDLLAVFYQNTRFLPPIPHPLYSKDTYG